MFDTTTFQSRGRFVTHRRGASSVTLEADICDMQLFLAHYGELAKSDVVRPWELLGGGMVYEMTSLTVMLVEAGPERIMFMGAVRASPRKAA